MPTNESKMFPALLINVVNLLAIMTFLVVMLSQIITALAPTLWPSVTEKMLWIGPIVLGLMIRDPLFKKTRSWVIPVYLFGWILLSISVIAIFVSDFVPLALWVNALTSTIGCLIASLRIITREFGEAHKIA